VLKAHPVIAGGAIVFSPTVEAVKRTCILLKELVTDVNTTSRSPRQTVPALTSG
jgi:hypothetical protein